MQHGVDLAGRQGGADMGRQVRLHDGPVDDDGFHMQPMGAQAAREVA